MIQIYEKKSWNVNPVNKYYCEEGDALVASLETDWAESDYEGGSEIVSVGGGTWSPFEGGA